MKKLLLFSLVVLGLFSCKKDEDKGPVTAVNLQFKAVYDGSPLMMYQDYTYPDGHLLRFLNFNFFIANVELIPESGSNVKLKDIGFVDFSDHTTLAEAETPIAVAGEKVPIGNYKGLRIGIGVPAKLNNADAGHLSIDNPLRQAFNTHFWSDWKSFIFMKCEGIYDLDNDGIFSSADRGFEHHAGADAVYQTVAITQPITIEEGETFDLNFVLDILKLYQVGNNALDLSDPANKDTQEASDLPLMLYLMENFKQALTIE